jgi:hypothetical protein
MNTGVILSALYILHFRTLSMAVGISFYNVVLIRCSKGLNELPNSLVADP